MNRMLLLPSIDSRLREAGYVHQRLAPVADVNDAIESGCSFCLCQGSLEIKPYWKGARLKLVVVCGICGETEER